MISIIHTSAGATASLNEEGLIVVQSKGGNPAFSSWKVLAEFFAAVSITSVEVIKAARSSLFSPDVASFGRWLTVAQGVKRSVLQERHYRGLLERARGEPSSARFIEAAGIEVVLHQGAFTIIDRDANPKVSFTGEEFVLLVAAILVDPRTQEHAPELYAPFLWSEADLGVFSEEPKSTEVVEIVVTDVAPDLDSGEPNILVDTARLTGALEEILVSHDLAAQR